MCSIDYFLLPFSHSIEKVHAVFGSPIGKKKLSSSSSHGSLTSPSQPANPLPSSTNSTNSPSNLNSKKMTSQSQPAKPVQQLNFSFSSSSSSEDCSEAGDERVICNESDGENFDDDESLEELAASLRKLEVSGTPAKQGTRCDCDGE